MPETDKDRLVIVMDTSVFIHDPEAIKQLSEDHPKPYIVVSGVVIEELDGLKNHSEKGFKSRESSRNLKAYQDQGKLASEFLETGVSIEGGATLIIDSKKVDFNHHEFSLSQNNDNRILLTAVRWREQGHKAIIITNDINFSLRSGSCGIDIEMYQGHQRIYNELYSGLMDINLPKDAFRLFGQWYNNGGVNLYDLPADVDDSELFPNRCIVFHSGDKTLLAIYRKADNYFRVIKKADNPSVAGKVLPKNLNQSFAYALSRDPNIPLVSLSGKAGSGKTIMALAAGYKGLKENKYEQIIVYRPMTELGADKMGALPGDVSEKMAPWKYPIVDAMSVILGKNKEGKRKLKDLLDKHLLVVEPVNYIQGRTLNGIFAIVDEGQNLSPETMNAVTTRVGMESKMILTGDVAQVGDPYLNAYTNGLTVAVDKLKRGELSGHITLRKSERSPLVEMINELWK